MTLKDSAFYNADNNFGYDSVDSALGNAFFDKLVDKGKLQKFCVGNSKSFEAYRDLCSIAHGKAQPCGKDTVGKIYRSLKKFFIVLRGVKKYLDKYVNQTINAVTNLQTEIQATITEIAAVLKTLVQRAREWVLKKIKKGIEDQIDKLTTPQTTEPKKALLSRIIDEIFCRFDSIIDGLFNLVGDFLYELIGKVINVPFCAVESFVNALLSKLLNDIDRILKPIFDKINKVLAPVSKIMGSVFQAIDFILGFESFLCEKPECNDELKEFEAGPWGRPQNTKTDNWGSFSFSSSIGAGARGLVDDFFGAGKTGNYTSPGGCYYGDFNCGTNIQFFGGGGSGAAGAAVVNKIGQVVGVNLFYGGSGYTSPPFVTFIDPGGCGNYASGRPILNSDGEVSDVVIDNPGIGYTDTFPLSPVIRNFEALPLQVEVDKNIIFSWNTENTTSTSLSSSEYTLTGHSNMSASLTSATIKILSTDVNFAAGESSKIISYTLTATRDVPGWSRQDITRDIDIEVFLPGSSPASPTPSTTSSLLPSILNFDADPKITTEGKVVKFNWSTLNTSFVGLGLSTGPGTVTSIYDNLIANGSGSIVLPSSLVFPVDGSNIINTYVLTATNSSLPSGSSTDVKYVSVEIVPPKSPLSSWSTPSATSAISITSTPILTGTLGDDLDKTDGEDISGSLEGLGTIGIFDFGGENNINIPGTDNNIGGPDGTSGGGNTPENNINNFLPLGPQITNGANIDPTGNSSETPQTSPDNVSLPGPFDIPITSTGTVTNVPTETDLPGTNIEVIPGAQSEVVDTNNQVISEIHSIEIVDTGIGYGPEDTVEIVGGNNGANFSIETTPTGQIVDIKVISGGQGFVTIPQIRINTIDGLGAKFKPILRFTPASEFTQKELRRIGTDKFLQIVDCVLR
jgi:hypothetical protein